ncbi:F-box DNA helicase 1 isoform X2 [Solea solea]|uniref:F-box DNA helicase 1 isoform X2 n=1 Tax=Solea solea TaxID=90069 RepID=UPI002729C925|nr:F-box DNA helicase 1 isoform X2 [Solea solea]
MEEALKGKAKRRHLSQDECHELAQSAGGSSSLTQPHTFNCGQGNSDPNRWLNPRTPNKLRKCVTSEPQAKDEEEEEEVDDFSLLAAVMESEAEKEEKVDYLEGITAEMFGPADEFEWYDSDIHAKEEEVEALPDGLYGLLGTSKNLLQPQGCIDDLPEEVLRRVLCFLPAKDLYCSASLVCHRWRYIVMDAKFMPYKKQYYRYMMKEKNTVLHMWSVLKNNNIAGQASYNHSIRHLVVLMAQHKVGEWVRPDDVLDCVKKHRLFPQAEASIRLRIPDIQKYINLNTEGPNPYAAMAVILILSECVGDVQALAFLLSGCLSPASITEYLSHMAMMLLALERNKIQISNRLHYNIFYVLHLMENGPFPDKSTQESRVPEIQLTGEQQRIMNHDIQADHLVKVIAFAGTGKTSTLVKYAEQRPHLRFLYVAFNRSVACEAQRRFSRNVDCKTVHSLAFSEIGVMYRNHKKLTANVKAYSINYVLPKGRGGLVKAKVISVTLETFMASADQAISIRHVPSTHTTNSGKKFVITTEEKELFVDGAQTIWEKMQDLNERKFEAFYMTHDGYLKLWQLQDPKPCLSDKYDVIFIDEAQDCNPATMDVLLSQQCAKILVGDPHQQIYTFRGAINALNSARHTHIYYLTQSFRFGAEIAYVAASLLRVCKQVDKILVGGKQKGSVCDETAVQILEDVRTGMSYCPGKTAILSRCNVSVFNIAVELTDANPHCRIHFIGDVQNIGLNRILDIWRLTQQPDPHPKFIRDPLIRSFARKDQNATVCLRNYIEQTTDQELSSKFNIVQKYGPRIPELVTRLRSCFEQDFHSADFIVGTVHKAKGLEFDSVMVTDDFVKVPSSWHRLHHFPVFEFVNIPRDEWNLLYVAVTRAKTTLIISESIRRLLTVAGEYYLKSAMPNSLMSGGGEPLPCSVSSCPNCITPGSAFVMSKRAMSCTDSVSEGGPLCERCVWKRIGPTAFLMTDDVQSMAAIPDRRPIQFVFF